MRWLCLDPGDKRTGVAISSPEGTFAVPVTVLEHEKDGPPSARVAGLLEEYGAEGLLIGLPLAMDGSTTAQTFSAIGLAQRIGSYFNTVPEIPPGVEVRQTIDAGPADGVTPKRCPGSIRVLLWDERLTSWDAQREVRSSKQKTGVRQGRRRSLDAHAAAVILQSFLETLDNSPTTPCAPEDSAATEKQSSD